MINTKINDDNILEELIIGYRNAIRERYHYQVLRKRYDFPETLNEKVVGDLREYFLDYIYPDIEKRIELNDAFRSLDDYIKHPRKLFRILVDSRRLLWTHGRHLPKILNTGFKAMSTYNAATKFENKLLEAARKKQVDPPFGREKIDSLLASISRNEIESFIESCKVLLGTLHDRKLMQNLKEILNFLISKMKEKEELYTSNEIRGLELGQELLLKGDLLFTQLTPDDQQRIVDLVIQVERDELDKIYS